MPVSAGSFGLALGEGANLGDAVFAQDALYLVIAVQDPVVGGAFTRLAGSQQLQAAPFANRAVAAKNFTVSSTLTVGGNANVGGSLDVASAAAVGGALTVDGAAEVGATSSPLALTSSWQNSTSLSTEHAEISNDTGTYKTLMVVGNRSGDTTTRTVGVWDHLDVNGTLTVDSTATFSADVVGLTATRTNCEWIEDQFEVSSDVHYLDRMNNIGCPADKFLADWNVDASGAAYKMKFWCCNITVQ